MLRNIGRTDWWMLCDDSIARESSLASPLTCCLEPAHCFYTYFHRCRFGLAQGFEQTSRKWASHLSTDNSVPRQSQERRDLKKPNKNKSKEEDGLWLLVEFSLTSGRVLFSPDAEHFNKKNTNISFNNTLEWHSLEMALSHIWLTKNICFFMHIYFRIATSKLSKVSNCLAYGTYLVSNWLAYGIWWAFFISWHTANTAGSTFGFFFPAFPVKIIYSPLGLLAVTADFHMQIFSACCKETEEHPHIFTSSSSQFPETAMQRVAKNGHAC